VNRGFDPWSERDKEAVGLAKFKGDPTVGALKVSFLWPFYGGYNVIDLDPDYGWAIIIGIKPKIFLGAFSQFNSDGRSQIQG